MNTIKIILVLLLVNLSPQLFGQTAEFGVIKGKVIDKDRYSKGVYDDGEKRNVLPGVNVFIELDSNNLIDTESDIKGNFEFSVPAGKHILKTRYFTYQNYHRAITVKPNDTLELEIEICNGGRSCRPWHSSLPYPELSGFWKPVTYFDGNTEIDQSKRKDKAGLSVYFINDTLPGKLAWNNGCYDYFMESQWDNEYNPHFRNLGNGIIEIHNKPRYLREMILLRTYIPEPLKCNNNINKEWEAFMSNIHEKKFTTSVTNEGQLLSISYKDEKFILRKIHNQTRPEFSGELIGTWSPVEGKLNGKKMEKFANNATIIFDWENDSKKLGVIKYKEKKDCVNEIILNYQYLDKDYISIKSLKWPTGGDYEKYRPAKNKICKHDKLIEAIHNSFSQYGGCHLQFNETKDLVTLKYDEDYLVLKRKE